MLNSRYLPFLIVSILSVSIFTTCKPKQKIVYSTSPVENKEHHDLFSDIITSEFPYKTFSAKLNMGMTSGTQSFSSKGNVRIVKDNAIQISIQPLFGVELFRFYASPDSIFLLDRMNKRYVLESISALKEFFPSGFNFYTMQSLFTNALFISKKKRIADTDFSIFNYYRASEHSFQILAKDPDSGIDYSFTVNGDDRITFTHLMQPERKLSLQWEYLNFVVLNSATFPHKMNVTLSSATRKFNTEFLFSDIVTDNSLQLPLNVPLNYTKTSIEEILKILTRKK